MIDYDYTENEDPCYTYQDFLLEQWILEQDKQFVAEQEKRFGIK